MKKLLFAAMLAALAISFTGCTTGYYMTQTSANTNFSNTTKIVLSGDNYRVVKSVHTYMIYDKHLKLDSESLRQSAYVELLKAANLTGAQVLTNVCVEKLGVQGAFIATRNQYAVLVTGTVIEFTK